MEAARASLDFSQVTTVGMGENSARRGQDYVSLFMDLDATPRVLFATQGRDAATVARYSQDLAAHGGDPGQVTRVCYDIALPHTNTAPPASPSTSSTPAAAAHRRLCGRGGSMAHPSHLRCHPTTHNLAETLR